jgi:hypothetical protein
MASSGRFRGGNFYRLIMHLLGLLFSTISLEERPFFHADHSQIAWIADFISAGQRFFFLNQDKLIGKRAT